jgi:hypothetical protein
MKLIFFNCVFIGCHFVHEDMMNIFREEKGFYLCHLWEAYLKQLVGTQLRFISVKQYTSYG